MNNFPPLFPQSKYLRSKNWHQFIWLISWIYSAASIYSFFLAFLVLLNEQGLTNFSIDIIFTWPLAIPLYPLMIFSHPTPHMGTVISYPIFQDPNWGLIILMFYFLASIFLPSIIYQIILGATLGKKWKSAKKKG